QLTVSGPVAVPVREMVKAPWLAGPPAPPSVASASLATMLTAATLSRMVTVAPVGLARVYAALADRLTMTVSLPSGVASLMTLTSMVALAEPAGMVTLPERVW